MATAEGDAQYSAHRSGSDAQDTAPAPPGIPSENVGAVPTGNPPSDTQFSAHRSGCGALDTGSRRPESHWTEYGDERARQVHEEPAAPPAADAAARFGFQPECGPTIGPGGLEAPKSITVKSRGAAMGNLPNKAMTHLDVSISS